MISDGMRPMRCMNNTIPHSHLAGGVEVGVVTDVGGEVHGGVALGDEVVRGEARGGACGEGRQGGAKALPDLPLTAHQTVQRTRSHVDGLKALDAGAERVLKGAEVDDVVAESNADARRGARGREDSKGKVLNGEGMIGGGRGASGGSSIGIHG